MTAVTSSGGRTDWHALPDDEVCRELDVRPGEGLADGEASRRLAEYGANELAEEERTPLWRRVLRLLVEPMTLVLVAAAVVSLVASGELKTPIVILVVVVFNAVLNLVQERRAENSLRALQDMTVTRARVRRGGRVQEVDAEQLVPGDVVLVDGGDVVPADGRLLESAGLEVQEAALTGESTPASKRVDVVEDAEAGVGDRHDMVFMSTAVTRGRGEFVVTATGMDTEIGRVADLLGTAGRETTPLQRQIAHLAVLLTVVAAVVVAAVFGLGVLRGESLSQLFLTAVSLAVATIPEGLTAVVAFTLAMGASRLARQGAIVKNLASVETLGATAHIGTDKTGTLTLNEMTARELIAGGRTFAVSGEGYTTDGELRAKDDEPDASEGGAGGGAGGGAEGGDVRDALLAMALCSDAIPQDGGLVGDPTEGALVVLAAKGGLEVDEVRRAWPRAAEVPFDSERKYMATYHRWADLAGAGNDPAGSLGDLAAGHDAGGRLMVKGAPDVLLDRSAAVQRDGRPVPLDDGERERLARRAEELSSRGLRVMAVAHRDIDENELEAVTTAAGDVQELDGHVRDLALLALVGIVDPPRPEVRDAIEQARRAGITVHMVTGDHVGTAAAIATDLGIEGDALSGNQLDELDDDELGRRATHLGVLARVSPEHKIRMVDALRHDGSVVAMTGDGVNDAPALKQADIGVAMGITGTEVSKGAAAMILTDDNFATIVAAVREGRGIYDNVVKFVRFQIATAWAFVMMFLAAGVLGLAGGAPFTALQILWVNIIMDGPPAMALGLDRVEDEAMQRPPRPVHERILTPDRIARVLFAGLVMAAGTLLVLATAPGAGPGDGSPTQAGTLAFTTFVLFQVFNLLNVRNRDGSVFGRHTLTNRWLWISVVAILVLQVLVVYVPVLQGFFDTTALDVGQWGLAVAVASSVLWAEELRKLVARIRRRRRERSERPSAAASS